MRGIMNRENVGAQNYPVSNIGRNQHPDPFRSIDKAKYDEEKLLIEQDPFLLEE